MSAKYTEGPWHIDWNGGMAPVILGVHTPGNVRHIAHVQFHGGSNDRDVHANARLISASPELIKALKDSQGVLEAAAKYELNECGLVDLQIKENNIAIAKAENQE